MRFAFTVWGQQELQELQELPDLQALQELPDLQALPDLQGLLNSPYIVILGINPTDILYCST
jgi:hypothetical protein